MTSNDKTILIVDDDQSHRTMLKAHLGAEWQKIIEADDGDVAFHLVKDRSIDLVLLDLAMEDLGHGYAELVAAQRALADLAGHLVGHVQHLRADGVHAAYGKGHGDLLTYPGMTDCSRTTPLPAAVTPPQPRHTSVTSPH